MPVLKYFHSQWPNAVYTNTKFSNHASIGNCQISHHRTKYYTIESINTSDISVTNKIYFLQASAYHFVKLQSKKIIYRKKNF